MSELLTGKNSMRESYLHIGQIALTNFFRIVGLW